MRTQSPADMRARRVAPLSDRELTVLQLVAYGKHYSDIAEELFITLGYVKALGSMAAQKLGAGGIAHAVAMALRRGIIE
ncbi:MAG TPA: helix-turn-helix transcriptional regulator [Clostridia bacterium]|nr:helix-turn-helix transcriptional regulator [Clostridia bacterium]